MSEFDNAGITLNQEDTHKRRCRAVASAAGALLAGILTACSSTGSGSQAKPNTLTSSAAPSMSSEKTNQQAFQQTDQPGSGSGEAHQPSSAGQINDTETPSTAIPTAVPYVKITGHCAPHDTSLTFDSGNFMPKSSYQVEVFQPDGQLYSPLINDGIGVVQSNGSLASRWLCQTEGIDAGGTDRPGLYTFKVDAAGLDGQIGTADDQKVVTTFTLQASQ